MNICLTIDPWLIGKIIAASLAMYAAIGVEIWLLSIVMNKIEARK